MKICGDCVEERNGRCQLLDVEVDVNSDSCNDWVPWCIPVNVPPSFADRTLKELSDKVEFLSQELCREVARTAKLEEENRRSRQLEIDGETAWRWGGDREDHLESMGNDMAVLIRAEDLRALLSGRDDG